MVPREGRAETCAQFGPRYRISRGQAVRVAAMATALHGRQAPAADAAAAQRLHWAALLHEIGFSVSHTGFHRHGAYILGNADILKARALPGDAGELVAEVLRAAEAAAALAQQLRAISCRG